MIASSHVVFVGQHAVGRVKSTRSAGAQRRERRKLCSSPVLILHSLTTRSHTDGFPSPPLSHRL